jgi:hypothetical protein
MHWCWAAWKSAAGGGCAVSTFLIADLGSGSPLLGVLGKSRPPVLRSAGKGGGGGYGVSPKRL